MKTETETGAGEPSRLVSITEAAEILSKEGDKIDRSSLSRYCDAHGLKRGKRGRSVVVDLDQVRAHRRANYTREVMSGRSLDAAQAQSEGAPEAALSPTAGEGASLPPQSPAVGVVQDVDQDEASADQTVLALDPARRKKTADAERAEIELAKIKGMIADAAEIEAGLADAVAAMRQTFGATAKVFAADAVVELGLGADRARELAVILKRYARQGEGRFFDGCAKTAGLVRDERGSTARLRLERLADLARDLRSDLGGRQEAGA